MATQIKISELPLANESALSVSADDRFIFNNDNVNTQTIKFGNLVDAICAQNLIFNGTCQFNQQLVGPNGGDLAIELDRLNDVTVNNVQSGQLLQFNGAVWTNVDANDTQIEVGGLDDVNLTDVADGDYLVYNANTDKWVNAAGPSGIGLTNLSVETGTATSGGALTYNELTGVFTFQPDSNTGYATQVELTTLSVAVNERITAITGVPTGEVNLGTFTGSTISDNTNVKVALQELETAIEAGGAGGVSAELIGVDAGDTDLGTFTNNPTYPNSSAQISDNQSVKGALQDLSDAVVTNNQLTVLNISDTYAVIGVPSGDRDLGVFDGNTIITGASVKVALQQLEYAVEAGGAGEVSAALIGVDAGAADLGTFTGNSNYPGSLAQITDNSTVKVALQDLSDAIVANNQLTVLNISDTYALFGVPSGDRDLGSFNGVTITDNSDVKEALQELETAVEATVSLADLQAEVAASTDFADFQARIAAMGGPYG